MIGARHSTAPRRASAQPSVEAVDTDRAKGLTPFAMRRFHTGFLIAAIALGQTGCLARLAANSTAKIMNQASPAIQAFADPATAEAAIPYSITQMEGLLLVIPQNQLLRGNLMRALGSYGFAFLEDHMEEAEVADDEARIEYYRNRASIAYLRGKEVGFETLTIEEDGDGGALGAYHRGIDAWRAYLQRFDDQEQVGMVFWMGYNWARHISLNKEDPDVLADLPFAIACFERVFALDPNFNNYAPYAAMGSYYARTSASLGGDPARAREMFETAIARTNGNFLTYKVMMARVYAVMVQDRALFTRLLQEVIDAGDVMPEQRLANQIAKRRARRYLAQIDDLIAPADDTPAEADAPAADAPAADAPAADAPAADAPAN
jgi:tetratricopeptide (TPR) repeat protein